MQKIPPGTVVDGFRFKGGNPEADDSWEPVQNAIPAGTEVDGFVFKGGDPDRDENWLDVNRTRGLGEVALDTAATFARGVIATPTAIANAISPGNIVAEKLGQASEFLGDVRSDVARGSELQRQREIEEAGSLSGEALSYLKSAIESPVLTAAEIVGNLAIPGGVVLKASSTAALRALAKGASKEAAEKAGTRAGTAAGAAIGGVSAGGDAAGTAFELVQQTSFDVLENDSDFRRLVDNGMNPEAAREELATRAARDAQLLPTLAGAAGGAIGFERLLAGGKAFGGGALSRTLKSGTVEAVPEAFEEGLTTFEGQRAAAEYNPDIDPMKGVGAAAAAGGLFGGIGGGAAGLASPIRNVPAAELEPAVPSVTVDDIAKATSVDEAIQIAKAVVDLPTDTSRLKEAVDAYLSPALVQAERDPNAVLAPMDESLPNTLVSVAGEQGIQTADIEPGVSAPAPQPEMAQQMLAQIQRNIEQRGMATPAESQFLARYAPQMQTVPTAAPSELPGSFRPSPELQGVKRQDPQPVLTQAQQFIATKRQENTPAAQEFVRQFDAGSITEDQITQQLQTQRELANQRAVAPAVTEVAQARIEEAAAASRTEQTGSAETAQARIEEAAAIGRMEQTKGTGKLVLLPSLGRADENGVVTLTPAEFDAQGQMTVPAKTIRLVDESSLADTSEVIRNEQGVVTAQRLSKSQYAALQQLVRPFGVQVQLYESDTAGDGFILPKERNKVFLNTRSSVQASSVVFHEVGHLIEREVPEAYAALKTVVLSQITEADKAGFAQYYRSEDFMADELVGDTVGQLLSKPETLTAVFDQIEQDYGTAKAKGIIARLIAALNKTINTLLKTFQNQDFKTVGAFVGKTEQDLKNLKAAVRDAAVVYARKQRGEAATIQGRMIEAERDVQLAPRSRAVADTAETPDVIGANLQEASEVSEPVLSQGRGAGQQQGRPQAQSQEQQPKFSKARVMFEVAPDPNNAKLKAKWDSFDDAEKTRISQEVLTQVMPEVLRAAEVKAQSVEGQIGGYLDDSNPSFTAIFDSAKLPLGRVLEATKLAGFALAQDSMMVVADKPFEGSFETGFITLTLPDSVDADSIESVHGVYQKLRQLDPEAIQGHTTVGREMSLAVPTDKLESIKTAIEQMPDLVFEKAQFSTQYMAFPTKEDYDYGNQRAVDSGKSKLASAKQTGVELRARAEQALNEAFERRNLQPRVERSSVPFRDKDGYFVRKKLGLNPDPRGREANRVREIAQAFDNYLKRMSGQPVIARDDYSEQARDALAQAVADEVAYQIQSTNSGLGWYSSNYPRAVKKLAKRFPELRTNENAQMVFSALVAITSNGEDVATNAANAVNLYEQYRSGKSLRDIQISSRRAEAMNSTLQRFAGLLERMPLKQARQYLLEEITVAQMNTELRAMGERPDSAYKADTVVPRSAVVLGPKIGAFFANLMGSEGYLTMDLWWTRSINRMRGLLIPEPTESSVATLRDLLNLPADADTGAVFEAARSYRNTYVANNFKSDLELAMGRKEGNTAQAREAFAQEARERFGKDYPAMYRDSRIQKAANTVLKTEEAINEAPANASDREFMYGVARQAQSILKETDVADLSLADIQAALWYYEKKLYEALSGKKSSDIGYDEAIARLADAGNPSDAVRKFKGSDKDQPKFSPARATAEVRAYAEKFEDSFFRTPAVTDTKDMVEIGRRLGLNIRRQDTLDKRPHVRELYSVNFGEGREAYVTVARRDAELGLADNDVYVNVGGLEPGEEGGRVYMAAGALAYNRGLRLVGDPDGITEAGKRRRLENMIALALKYKTTSFFTPHRDMIGWNGLQWRGSDDQKLQFMLQSSYAVSSKLVPEIKNVTFDENTGEFRSIDDGSPVPPSAFKDMAARARAATPPARRDGMPGSGTLRLGVIYKSLASAADPAQLDAADRRLEPGSERTRALRDSTKGLRFSTARVNTPEFKAWFGDSKVVDADGNPLVVYHGTIVREDSARAKGMGNILAFDRMFTTQFRSPSIDTVGSWFSTNPGEGGAEMYSGRGAGSTVYPVYLSIKNPQVTTFQLMLRRARLLANGKDDGRQVGEAEVNAYRKWLKDTGKDGIKIEGSGNEGSTEFDNQIAWVALEPTQIKSATGNVGTFDPENPDIRFSTARVNTPEFKRWFGDSKVVDADGKPLVVYHATTYGDFDSFNKAEQRKGMAGYGFYFTDRFGSEIYADYGVNFQAQRDFKGVEKKVNVMPVYLRMTNPLVVDNISEVLTRYGKRDPGQFGQARQFGGMAPEAMTAIQRDGYDGVISNEYVKRQRDGSYKVVEPSTKGAIKHPVYVTFEPTQIKSAIGNVGTFDPENPDIRFSTKREVLMDNVIYKLQDKLVDLKRIQQDIAKSGKVLQDEINAYQREELYHGRSAKQSQDFLNKELNPLLEEMRLRKVDRDEFEKYLWNRHAEERNIQIAKVNDRFPDGGSGIKTADARAYLAGLTPEKRTAYEALAARVDRMVAKNLELMVQSGLETQDTVNAMRGAYSKYVPLMRGEGAGYTGTGSGYSIKGATTKRALGSDKPVEDILSSLASQRDKIITRAEKARVGRAVMGLALENPDDNVWFVFDPLLNDPAKNPGQREALRDQLDTMGVDPDLADEISAQPYEEVMGPNGRVVKRPNRKLMQVPNAIAVRINGEDKFLVFNQNNPNAKRMAESLANLDTVRLEGALGAVAKISRYFASINTQYNPVFGIVNLIRDVQGAMVNLSSTKIAGKQAQVTKGLLPAIGAIYQVTRARRDGDTVDGEWAQLYERFQNVGAQTGFRDMFESARERTEKQLDRTLDPSVAWQTWQKTGAPVFDWLSDYNETLENAVRLSAFKVALDQGLTDEQAASVAKNLTVNFNRRGQIGTQAGAIYAFFNASVQGSARLVETLKGPKGRQIVGAGLLLGVAQTVMLAMAGYDDEEPPEFIKERNLVIPTGGDKYITVPMPLGLHVIPNLGRIAAEQLMGRTQASAAESVARIFGTVVDAFNPVGSSTFLQTLSPTVLDPAVALSENRDFSGKPIYREDFNPSRPTPGYTRARDNSIESLTALSQAINFVTGGSDFSPGLVSPTPDQLEYILGQLTGGVGREVSKVVQVAETSVTGEELPPYKVPLFGRLYGDRAAQSSQGGQFYANLSALHEHKLEIEGRQAEGVPYQDYVSENPEAVLYRLAEKTERRVQELRRRKSALKDAGAGPETIRQVEDAITATMKRFNETVATARGRTPAQQ